MERSALFCQNQNQNKINGPFGTVGCNYAPQCCGMRPCGLYLKGNKFLSMPLYKNIMK